MQLSTGSFVEHQTATAPELEGGLPAAALAFAPGACTTCLASTSCSCCCSAAGASTEPSTDQGA